MFFDFVTYSETSGPTEKTKIQKLLHSGYVICPEIWLLKLSKDEKEEQGRNGKETPKDWQLNKEALF